MRGFVLSLTLLVLAAPLLAQEEEEALAVTVGTKESPPFSMKDGDGGWQGISIELLEEIAVESGWKLEFEERPLEQLFAGLEDGSLDVAAAALSITPEREKDFDFSYPYYEAGLGIAVAGRTKSGFTVLLESIFSPTFLGAAGLLLLLLLGVGLLIWMFERRGNDEQFGGRGARGIGAGLWWSAVTMTTVGYGDKAPVTVLGRVVGLIWMFASIILISSFTAAIASSLTISQMEAPLSGPEGLDDVRVATVRDSTSEDYLDQRRIVGRTYEKLEDALRVLAEGGVDAVVYDAPILRWHVRNDYEDELSVLPARFASQPYGFALPPDSPLRESLNRALLGKRQSSWWGDMVFRYLGN